MASVFVRNLPFGVTQEDLEQVFSEIGPVRKIDVIKDKGKRKSEMLTRGFAFVKFAVESDAAVAVEKLNKSDFQGRKMLIDYAMEKGKRRGVAGGDKPAASEKPKQEEMKPEEKQEEEVQTQEPEQTEEDKQKAKAERRAAKEERRAAKAARKAAKAEAKVKVEAEEKPAKVTPEVKAKPAKVKQEVKVEATPAAAAPTPAASGHAQSERNARRRQHREFLRDVERRKEEQASVEEKSVLIFGLGADVTQKHVLKKAKKVGAVDKVELKEEARTGKTYALVKFKNTKDAALAVAKLDHHIFKGSVLQVKSAAKAVVVDDKRTAGKPGHPKHAAEAEGLRLIVRNLAFQTTDKDLEKLFEVHGPLFEARVVRMPVEENKKEEEQADGETNAEPVLGRSRGFGFVQYRDVVDARAAVEKLNGTKIKGREMIVDFALSKTKYLEQQKKQEEEAVAAAAPEGDEEDEEANSGDEDEDQLEMPTDDEAEMGSDVEEEEAEAESAPAPKVDTEAQRERTLFIRNLSFQTSEDGLREFFQTFGAVEYARVVYEKGSGLSKGVGFVRFKSADVAAEVLKRGEQPQVDDKKKHKKDKKKDNMFSLSALADGGDDALTLDGRQLILSRAVSKTDAEQLADSNARERRRLDKRNLYLAYEGTLNVNKVADDELELPKMDIDKRRRAIREKKLKLQNPMYFVSPMRLSVRNLSTALDDRKLKKLFHDAASAGGRAGNVDRAEIKAELLPKGAPPVKVRMAKVVRDMESAKAGKDPRSRGYGFVEFSEHLHALAALRILNNNPKYTSYAAGRVATSGAPDSSKSRLIVEFALENHGKLKLREKRAADAAKKREEERALKEAQGEDGGDAETTKKSRGQRQREKKKLRAQVKAEAKAETEGDKTKPKKAPKVVKELKQQPKKRKRAEAPRGDAEDDALASLETAHLAKKGKTLSRNQRKHSKELEKEKSFEDMVRSYKKEIFGEKAAVGGASKGDDSADADRWFD
ncbi:RNA-binding protein 28 [Phytophthora pseudosyringae]|uniref:RNA-binding protein 28 n=1 Tax=Phytophthora pseudosyringae TaxID=221518 RepID=A0A8T1VDR0_9STRA|nr:RNA-binding protein 28 [Phytophthora pseudosyringae]